MVAPTNAKKGSRGSPFVGYKPVACGDTCALGRIRTCNLLIRSQVLYPLSHERLP